MNLGDWDMKNKMRYIAVAAALITASSAQAWWGGPFSGLGDGWGDGAFSFHMGGGTHWNGYGYGAPYYGYPYGAYLPGYAYPNAAPAVDQATLEKQAKAQQEAMEAQRKAWAEAIEAQQKAAAEYAKNLPAPAPFVEPWNPAAMTQGIDGQFKAMDAYMEQERKAMEQQMDEERKAMEAEMNRMREERKARFERYRGSDRVALAQRPEASE